MVIKKTYPKWKALLHAHGVGIIKDGVTEQTKLTARVSRSVVVEDGSVADQHVQLAGSVVKGKERFKKWISNFNGNRQRDRQIDSQTITLIWSDAQEK